jgi:adenylate kinase
MIILVTGMVGIDKKQYLTEVCGLARQQDRDVLLCNVGDRMYDEAPDITPGRILDISLQRLHSLRRSIFKDIIAKAQTHEHIIVNTHATFRWRHGLFPAFDFYQIRQLNPDLFVCLIDSIEPLHVRLTSEHHIRHSLKDLMVWREEEVLATEMMQKGTNENAPFYSLARGARQGTAETFYRLVFEPWRKKVYLSFPMTHVAGMTDILAEIDRFRETMKELFVCFDPGDLEEAYLPYYAEQAAKEGEKGVELEVLGQKFCLEVDEIKQIQQDIDSQIYARDFALIDQADRIISFIPELPDGMPAPSVFVTQTATKIFRDAQEALKFFKNTDSQNDSTDKI